MCTNMRSSIWCNHQYLRTNILEISQDYITQASWKIS